MGRPRACVFCGSRDPADPVLANSATRMADALADGGYDLVYGGTKGGLMGRLAARMLARGAGVIGIVPAGFEAAGILQPGLTRLITVESMHERKFRMVTDSDAFVVLPGGFGTLDELFEVLTLGMLGAHKKATGILDVGGFYAPLLAWIAEARRQGFLSDENLALFFVEQDPDELVARLARHPMPDVPRLLRMDES